jgi:hypothetical protein
MMRQWGGIYKEEDEADNVFANVEEEEEDEAGEEGFTPNNNDFEEIRPDFKKSFLDAKHALYTESVLKPDEDSDAAQDNQLLELYETYIKMFYTLCKDAKAGRNISRVSISLFPKKAVDSIVNTLTWVTTFYKNNSPKTTIPYSHFIDHHLYTNIYTQA